MATTGELRAIIQELHLVDMGDAATYLGEEALVEEELPVTVESALVLAPQTVFTPTSDVLAYQLIHA